MLIGGVAGSSVRATLCRCGASSNKPYCDGSHAEAGFVATGEPPVKESEPLAARDGPVEVLPLPNGPLKLAGNIEVVSGTGKTLNRATQVFLCRCGASKSKPYCDGSHKAAGFVAE
jgi:CDGSH-type Zn-finger protein